MMLEITLRKLNQTKLFGMTGAIVEQNQSPMYSNLLFEGRLGLLIDSEYTDIRQPPPDQSLKRRALAISAGLPSDPLLRLDSHGAKRLVCF